jgi:hypothetical protein
MSKQEPHAPEFARFFPRMKKIQGITKPNPRGAARARSEE